MVYKGNLGDNLNLQNLGVFNNVVPRCVPQSRITFSQFLFENIGKFERKNQNPPRNQMSQLDKICTRGRKPFETVSLRYNFHIEA